jgi:hypothetical protein
MATAASGWFAVLSRTIPTSPSRASSSCFRRNALLDIRGEFFKAFNHPQYADSAVAYGTASFGFIQSTSVAARIIQLAAKIQF